ncbi:hypothetical protein G7054_g7249 [Neopestalotiopsis clavispora]|nr:hypothetical protein G7054_g7249 [Neopestalotiopsis clavispora]
MFIITPHFPGCLVHSPLPASSLNLQQMFFILFGAVWCVVMRLLSLQEDGLPIVTDNTLDPPPYAILSHTWGSDNEEVSFQDIKLRPPDKDDAPGYRKIKFCAEQAAADGLQHVWIDTCCIKRDDAVELQEAITSMYKWYQNSTRCYVYLSDVRFDSQNPNAWRASFRRSRWFKRGWTLQELLAPPSVEFFDRSGKRLGDKTTLKDILHDITSISEKALRGCPLSTFTVHERESWTRDRRTTRKEDKAYCLLGIFGVSMFLNYGEGEEHAMERLRREIDLKGAKDQVTHCVVPFDRNASFVGRNDILCNLSEEIPSRSGPQDCQRIAIHGLDGTGKTQIALEAAYELREWHPDHSVYWVSAANRRDFENSYRKIGKALNLPIVGADRSSRATASAPAGLHKSSGTSDSEPDFKASVTAALSRSATSWLLIIDDLDDPELLSSSRRSGAIHDYLPFNKRGSILITTRNQEVATKLGIAADRTFSIGGLTESESLKMSLTVSNPTGS